MPNAPDYLETHPWITFSLDLDRAAPKLWLQLGEVASKIAHISGVPLRPETATELHKVYLAKGAQATTAIEGNTLSEAEVIEQIEGSLRLPPSKKYLAQEVMNIVDACNEILRSATRPALMTPEQIKAFDQKVLEGLDLDEGVVPGQFRGHNVTVGSYRGPHYQDVPELVGGMCDWLNGPTFDPPEEDMEVPFAVLKAIVAHVYLAWIHPFGDGNGRTARLLEFFILVAAGVPSPAAHLLSNHYNQTRSQYYRQLDQAGKRRTLIPFIRYAVQGFVDGLVEQVDRIRQQQWEVTWENFVHSAFRNQTGPAAERRKWLTLDLSPYDNPVSRQDLRELTPRLARAYAGKTDKTLSRDINALLTKDLIRREEGGWLSNKERILAFLPTRVMR